MNDKQRDGRLNEITYPKYGKKRILEIINKFEPSEEVKKQEALRLEFRFFKIIQRGQVGVYNF